MTAAPSCCAVCGEHDWLTLPDPHPGRSITTAAKLRMEPLGKSQCSRCGFVQRTRCAFLGDSDYYEAEYATYYERPGTEAFHEKRYESIASWMRAALGSYTPSSILDIGCGQGWMLSALGKIYPGAELVGLEPSVFNAERAEARGFLVIRSKLEPGAIKRRFDLVISNNVIQHVSDPRAFLDVTGELVNDNGVAVLTCPNGAVPNIEILWADQNYSYLPTHLMELAHSQRFTLRHWQESPPSPSLPPAQLLLLSNNAVFRHGTTQPPAVSAIDLQGLFQRRSAYLSSIAKIEQHLLSSVGDIKHVFNFGASYWSSVLAGYCPRYWERVEACVIEDGSDNTQFLGKEVRDIKNIRIDPASALVLGIAPNWQPSVADRLKQSWPAILRWDQLIAC